MPSAQTHAPARRRRKATTIGVHGPLITTLLYRYGGLTREQIVRLTGLHERNVSRQLGYLEDAGRVLKSRDAAAWRTASVGRPRAVYYLARSGVLAGGRELGVENERVAARDCRRVQMPETTAHRVLANEYLLAVSAAARELGIEAPPEEVWCEACPDFPLFGTAVAKTRRRDTAYRYARMVPDGVFALECGDGTGDLQRYHLELETAVRTRQVTAKVADYAGRWRRLVAPAGDERRWHDPAARLEPLAIVTRTPEHAGSLQRSLRERLPQTSCWEEALGAVMDASGRRVDPRQLVLLAGYEQAAADPLARVYRPLVKYPDGLGGWKVSLRDAADLAGRVGVPERLASVGKGA